MTKAWLINETDTITADNEEEAISVYAEVWGEPIEFFEIEEIPIWELNLEQDYEIGFEDDPRIVRFLSYRIPDHFKVRESDREDPFGIYFKAPLKDWCKAAGPNVWLCSTEY